MSPSTSAVIEHDFSTTFNSYNPAVASVFLCYPCITVAGIKTNRQLLKQLRLVAGDLFDQHQAHLASVHALLPNKASWTETCLAMTCYHEIFPTEAVVGVRVGEDLGSPHLLLCDAFAKALLRRCPDRTTTIRVETHSIDNPHLPPEDRSHTKTHTITVRNGQLMILV
jgi:hypothetical protein